MKRFLFVLSFLVIVSVASGPLLAQGNPFVGNWKLNLAKSKFEPGPAPKSQTRSVVAEGEGAKYSFQGVGADGTSFAYSFTVNYDGKDNPITGTGPPGGADTIRVKLVSSNKHESMFTKAGQSVVTSGT